MRYTEFGKTGIKVSALGYGAMRLPMTEAKEVDDEKAIPMIHRAFELGVNYIDTAPYYLESKSEITVGKALKGWRDKVYLSTKNPIENNSGDDFRKRLEKSLKQLDTDRIDFYHMWGINLDTYKNSITAENGPLSAALKAKEEGLIGHISFSFHDKAENMKEIVDSGYFESVLMQYNLLDRQNEKNIDYCHEKGLGVVIMGPVAGGRLGAPNKVIQDMLGGKASSSAEMALRFVLANQGVNVALSGMNSIEQVEENAKVASIEGTLTAAERAQVDASLAEINRLAELYCTGCNYCMPCPQGLNIPEIFKIMNNHRVYGLTDHAKWEYGELTKKKDSEKKNASSCVECGACESKCPQKIEIIRQLKDTHLALA
ncbi:aldo/keto reductase [Clostridia bacterium]|nr:aldo/keto reductase [Clostridia bacterium]